MPGRIIIADDVAINRIVLKVKLSAASYGVMQVAGLDELLIRARQSLPDLILLDGNFQNDRCIDICHDLKHDPQTASIAVMILATDFTAAERLAALHAGACDVLNKPVADEVLLARVRNSMRVRSIEDELRLREDTATELGFNENTAKFSHPAEVLVVTGDDMPDLAWKMPFQLQNPCNVHQLPHASVLDAIASKNLTPDIILLPANPDQASSGRFLLAELRNQEAPRHAAIIVIDNQDQESAAITALDMGANEVISASTPPAEFAFRLARQLQRKQKADQLRDTLKDGLRLAVTDPLTGLFNRRYAFHHMARIAKRSNATNSTFAVMVLDLDRFKRVNDTHGHRAGDQVLKEIATRLKNNVRSVDLIARIGGEEFLVVMPDTGIDAARLAAERLRRVTEAGAIAIPHGHGTLRITTSIGVCIGGVRGQVDTSVEAMVDRADHALLAAKSTGRNQVIIEKSAA